MKKRFPLPPDLESAFYDSTVTFFQRTDVQFYLAAAKSMGGPVLEIGCGTGRILIPLARKGLAVTGLDRSPSMLAACRRKMRGESAEIQSRVNLVRSDMRRFRLGRQFRLVIIPYCTFQFLTSVEDQLECLATIARHLLPGGKLVLDLFYPGDPSKFAAQASAPGKRGLRFSLPDGRKVLRRGRYSEVDARKQIVTIESISDVGGEGKQTKRYVRYLRLQCFHRSEAELLLARAGFRLVKVYGDFDKTPFRPARSTNMILVAAKSSR